MRLIGTIAALAAILTAGCRSFGRFPGIDPGEYAYAYFEGKVSQIYPQPPAEVEASTLEALADMGFRAIEPTRDGEIVKIHAKTIDHRHAWLTIRPRNAMTELTVRVGIEGDELVSQALVQRVALNFGALPRTFIPLEPALQRRDRSRIAMGRPSVAVEPGPVVPEEPPTAPGPFSGASSAEVGETEGITPLGPPKP